MAGESKKRTQPRNARNALLNEGNYLQYLDAVAFFEALTYASQEGSHRRGPFGRLLGLGLGIAWQVTVPS